jgi:hypothetical protein
MVREELTVVSRVRSRDVGNEPTAVTCISQVVYLLGNFSPFVHEAVPRSYSITRRWIRSRPIVVYASFKLLRIEETHAMHAHVERLQVVDKKNLPE